jgi:hypothetical protein
LQKHIINGNFFQNCYNPIDNQIKESCSIHSIWECVTMYTVRQRVNQLILSALLLVPAAAAADNILIFGDRPGDAAILETTLEGIGHTVTNVGTLPGSLNSYDTIWHVGAFVALTGGEQTQLAAFLATGGGVHLTGERPCCEVLNDSLQSMVNSVVSGGGIQVGDLGDIAGPYSINASAVESVASSPNSVSVWVPSASGGVNGIGSLPDANILVTGAGDVAVGGIWTDSDLVSGGRLSLLMDVNWFSNLSGDNVAFIENLENFLASGSAIEDPVPVPTMANWSLALMGLLLLGFAARRLRKA